jgi:nucleotide-binding universal stress UspA family protein
MQSLRHLVVGTDFSECAEHALDSAIMLGNLSLARITLVHVCALSAELELPETTFSQDEDLLRRCGEHLEQLVASRARYGLPIAGVLRSGKPWEKISNVAAEVGASLIVVGRHGAGRGPAAALGTVADRLIQAASRPVLVIPSDLTRGLRNLDTNGGAL